MPPSKAVVGVKYFRVERRDGMEDPIHVRLMQMFDANGLVIPPKCAHQYPIYANDYFPASNAISDNLDSFSHTNQARDAFIEVEYDPPVSVARIRVHNRIDISYRLQGCCILLLDYNRETLFQYPIIECEVLYDISVVDEVQGGNVFPTNAQNMLTLPRFIIAISLENKTIQCIRGKPGRDLYAISHRWEKRDETSMATFHVQCEGESSYSCMLSEQEALHIDAYLKHYGNLFLDYVSIDQSSHQDKCDQVAIMGNIYFDCTSLIVGPKLSPTPPPEEYLKRAWCLQERSFGFIKFSWIEDEQAFIDHTDYMWSLVFAVTERTALHIIAMPDYFVKKRKFDWFWHVKSTKDVFPNIDDEMDTLLDLMQTLVDDEGNMTKLSRAKIAQATLRVRQKMDVRCQVEPSWGLNVFISDCEIPKDRIYGAWSVPMYAAGYSLPYDDPVNALAMIQYRFLGGRFCLYENEEGKRLVPYADLRSLKDVLIDAILQTSTASVLEDSNHVIFKRIVERIVVCLHNSTVGLGVNLTDDEDSLQSVTMKFLFDRSIFDKHVLQHGNNGYSSSVAPYFRSFAKMYLRSTHQSTNEEAVLSITIKTANGVINFLEERKTVYEVDCTTANQRNDAVDTDLQGLAINDSAMSNMQVNGKTQKSRVVDDDNLGCCVVV